MMRQSSIRYYLPGLLLILLPIWAAGQFYNGSQMSFGKNRVQYKEFFWTFYKFDQYDIYFYLGGQELALYTAKVAEESLELIEDKLDSPLEDKIQFIIFNTFSDLKQSNIGLVSDERYNTGGITHIIGKKVFLYFDGDHAEFDRQIRAGVAQALINNLLFGGSIGSQIKNTSLFPYPDWYMQGLVSYMSEEWSTEIDNRVRDGILNGRYDKFNRLTGEEATYAGHAFWNFIAERYGASSISNIIYMAKVSRKIESGFLYILGTSFKNLVTECIDYYKARYEPYSGDPEFTGAGILKKHRSGTVYHQLRISPDGRYAAYVANHSGQYRLWLQELGSGKKKKLVKGGFRLDEKVDYSYPLLAWHPSGRELAVIVERKGEPHLYYFDVQARKPQKVILYQFEKVLDMAYAPDGRRMTLSAVQRGQSDIYLYDIGSNSYEQITKDQYDDRYPRMIDRGRRIIFSSNRPDDTLRIENKYIPESLKPNLDLFIYDYAADNPILQRVTQTALASEKDPMEYGDQYFTYLSDENGIYNRFIGRIDSTISYVDTAIHYRYYTSSFPVTQYSRNILEHDVVPEIMKYGQVIYKDQTYWLQVFDMMPVEDLEKVGHEATPYMSKISDEQKKRDEAEQEAGEQPGGKRRFRSVRQSDVIPEKMEPEADTAAARMIDIRNYTFEQEKPQEQQERRYTTINVPLPGQRQTEEFEPPKRLNYNVEYFLNEIVTQIDFSFLNATYQPFTGGDSPLFLNPGFNALFKVGVTDLLEDYRITGGVRLNLNLINNEYLFSYANLRKRMDKEIVLHRQAVENYYGWDIVRVYSHEVYYMMKWPFSPVLSIKGTLSYRNDMSVWLSTESTSLRRPNFYQNWMGAKGELIYDNTRNLGLNLYQGTRYKVFAEYYQLADDLTQNLMVVGLDYRNYQRIHRSFIWANRFAASTSLGNNKLIYYMGGVDNWLVPRFNRDMPVDYSQNYAYQTLATNMRGFDQNIRNGNSFAVINTEFRFPVFRFFSSQPIRSDFLNNFQVVAFGDVGTAWTGPDPYSEENYLFTNIIEQNPLWIKVQLQKEPLVGGCGLGARTRLLGYFLRADLAWGVEDLEIVHPPVFYISLSLDF
ncbi:MAG: PD40 domain-containing protein [Bacteroidales bacterium]|nr:PD40 domain-containing protein [Bacteroidales bacterium]